MQYQENAKNVYILCFAHWGLEDANGALPSVLWERKSGRTAVCRDCIRFFFLCP